MDPAQAKAAVLFAENQVLAVGAEENSQRTAILVVSGRAGQRLPCLCHAIEAIDPSSNVRAEAIAGREGHSTALIWTELPVANQATVQTHFDPLGDF